MKQLILSFTFSLLLISMMLPPAILAQSTGQIFGKVNDESNGDPLIGVTVLIEGSTKGAATDIDGKYVIKGLADGKYNLKISAVGYSPKKITDIVVQSSKPVEYNILLSQNTLNEQEVVITAEEVHSAESAILAQRKKATTISDGISSEQIKRAPDATSSDALRRVTGLAIADNKFVYIRGVTDRYNGTTLDGAAVTSTELGKKSFSFDLVPANLIENISVVKSATPDLPGDFSGGLVQLNTLDFPSKSSLKVNFGESYNNLTTTKDMVLGSVGSKGWLGINDGYLDYPGDQPQPTDIGKKANNTWGPKTSKSPLNNSFSLAYGNHIELSSDDPNAGQLGFITALSYKNSFQISSDSINDPDLTRNSSGSTFSNTILWGTIANLSYKFSGLHKISFKNNFNQSGINTLIQYNSFDYTDPASNFKFTTIDWTQRGTYTGQLVGDHTFPSLGGTSFQWRLGVSSSRRDQPDRKEVTYRQSADDPSLPFAIGVNQRSWSLLNTRSINESGDFTIPISSIKFKIGTYNQFIKENFSIRYFQITPDYQHGFIDSLRYLPLDEIYDQQNYGPHKFLMSEISHNSDSYYGEQKIFAAYSMVDIPFELASNKFQFVGGARLENDNQIIDVPKLTTSSFPSTSYSKHNADILPSMNLTYVLNEKTNIRLAYSQSVNRPELYELSPAEHYNYILKVDEGGNLALDRALIKNYDVRVEMFPNIGELVAVSYFSKTITNAIEQVYYPGPNPLLTWANSPTSNNKGWEFEARKSLDFLGGYMSNFSITGNYTRVFSDVELHTTGYPNTDSTYHRPMQGQYPSTINLSLLFMEPTFGTSISLLYNRYGTRLAVVGFQGSSPPDTYEEAREVLDLSISQPIQSFLEAKFTIKNLTNSDLSFARNWSPYRTAHTGQTYSLSLSYSF